MNGEERGFRESMWQATTRDAAIYPPLQDPLEADVVVIGGGLTGLSSALHLGEFGQSVAVLEANDIAWGASGRNGGQVNPGWKVMPSQIIKRYGRSRGKRILKLIDAACDLVFELIDRHGIDCAPRRAPYFRAACGKRGIEEARQWVREWGEHGAPVSFKNRSESQQIVGSEFFQGGMEDARGGSLQPLAYSRGLARAAVKSGAQMFSKSRVCSINRVKNEWQLVTENGTRVSARFLILATNGYTDQLWPKLQKQIVPVASLQTASYPLPEDILRTLLPQGHHLSDSRRAMIYCRVDETRRFQIGGRGSLFSPTRQHANTRHLQAEARNIFPQLRGIKWEFEWGGLVAMTKHHSPHLIKLGQNAYAGLGYNGRGIAMSTIMGKQLAELIMGEDVPMPREKLSPFTFHQFRNAGITLHTLAGRVMDRYDRYVQ